MDAIAGTASKRKARRKSCSCNWDRVCEEISSWLEEHDPEYAGCVVVRDIETSDNVALRAAVVRYLHPKDTSVREYHVMKHHWPRSLVMANKTKPHRFTTPLTEKKLHYTMAYPRSLTSSETVFSTKPVESLLACIRPFALVQSE